MLVKPFISVKTMVMLRCMRATVRPNVFVASKLLKVLKLDPNRSGVLFFSVWFLIRSFAIGFGKTEYTRSSCSFFCCSKDSSLCFVNTSMIFLLTNAFLFDLSTKKLTMIIHNAKANREMPANDRAHLWRILHVSWLRSSLHTVPVSVWIATSHVA